MGDAPTNFFIDDGTSTDPNLSGTDDYTESLYLVPFIPEGSSIPAAIGVSGGLDD